MSYDAARRAVKEHARRDELRREIYRLATAIMATDPECRRHTSRRCQRSDELVNCQCDGPSFAFRIALEMVAHLLEVSYSHPEAEI